MCLPLGHGPTGNSRTHPRGDGAAKLLLHFSMLSFTRAPLVLFENLEQPMRTAGPTSANGHAVFEIGLGGRFSMSANSSLQKSVSHVDAALPTLKVFVLHGLLNEHSEMLGGVHRFHWPVALNFIDLLI